MGGREGGGALRLSQVLIKPRKTSAVHWWQEEGGLLSLVNIKSTHPPLPIYDTLGKLVSAHRAQRHTLRGGCVLPARCVAAAAAIGGWRPSTHQAGRRGSSPRGVWDSIHRVHLYKNISVMDCILQNEQCCLNEHCTLGSDVATKQNR